MTTSIPPWALVVIGLAIPVSILIGVVVIKRVIARIGRRASEVIDKAAGEVRKAARDATLAADDAAKLVATVAVKTEEVKIELKAVGQATATKLVAIEEQSKTIHGLVNNQMSEVLKKNAILADLLLATDPDNVAYQQLAKDSHQAVEDHAPADSSKDDESE
jgi:hypothetical protein